MSQSKIPELVCPAGSLPALKAAIDNGADTVYFGYKNDTNARNFAGLNFDRKAMVEGIDYAHARGRHVLMAINTFPQPGREADWHAAVESGVFPKLGMDGRAVFKWATSFIARATKECLEHLEQTGKRHTSTWPMQILQTV